MTQPDGITAPAQVEEGSTGPIEVEAPGSRSLVIGVSTTGRQFSVQVGSDGKARFELPPDATAGATLLIMDEHKPERSTSIAVVPGSVSR